MPEHNFISCQHGNSDKNTNTETKDSFWSTGLASETFLFAGNLFRQYINHSDSFSPLPSPVTAREQEVSQCHRGTECWIIATLLSCCKSSHTCAVTDQLCLFHKGWIWWPRLCSDSNFHKLLVSLLPVAQNCNQCSEYKWLLHSAIFLVKVKPPVSPHLCHHHLMHTLSISNVGICDCSQGKVRSLLLTSVLPSLPALPCLLLHINSTHMHMKRNTKHCRLVI